MKREITKKEWEVVKLAERMLPDIDNYPMDYFVVSIPKRDSSQMIYSDEPVYPTSLNVHEVRFKKDFCPPQFFGDIKHPIWKLESIKLC